MLVGPKIWSKFFLYVSIVNISSSWVQLFTLTCVNVMGLSLVMYSAYLHVNIPQSLPFICWGISCKSTQRSSDTGGTKWQNNTVQQGKRCFLRCNTHIWFFTVQGPVWSVKSSTPFVLALFPQVFPMDQSASTATSSAFCQSCSDPLKAHFKMVDKQEELTAILYMLRHHSLPWNQNTRRIFSGNRPPAGNIKTVKNKLCKQILRVQCVQLVSQLKSDWN